jgi:hypothetical protein
MWVAGFRLHSLSILRNMPVLITAKTITVAVARGKNILTEAVSN